MATSNTIARSFGGTNNFFTIVLDWKVTLANLSEQASRATNRTLEILLADQVLKICPLFRRLSRVNTPQLAIDL